MKNFEMIYKNKTNKALAIIGSTLLICILLLSVGFSSFSINTSITAQAYVRVRKDIRITGITVTNTTNGASSNFEEYNVHNISSSANLPNANSTITYRIEVTNIGNVEQGILAIYETYKSISTNTNSNLEIKSKTINLKETLCDDINTNKCKLGSITTFNITIGYKNNGYDGTNLTHSVDLDFDFRRMYDITYIGFSGNTSGLPNKMIDGENKTITFNNTSGIPTKVVVTGATGSYTSPNLVLSNVIIENAVDTIVITKAYSISYTGFSGDTSGLTSTATSTGGTITFDNTSGIPTSVTVTGATSSYTSPNLVISNVTDNVVVAGTFSSGTTDPYVYLVNVGQYVLHNNPIPSNLTIYNTPAEAMAAFDNRPYYFKHLLENDIVVESYIEFVITPELASEYPEMTAGTYALRGGINEENSNDKPVYEANIATLKTAFGADAWYCSYSDPSIVYCYPGPIGVQAFPNGDVGIYTNDIFCGVDSDGDSNCGLS